MLQSPTAREQFEEELGSSGQFSPLNPDDDDDDDDDDENERQLLGPHSFQDTNPMVKRCATRQVVKAAATSTRRLMKCPGSL